MFNLIWSLFNIFLVILIVYIVVYYIRKLIVKKCKYKYIEIPVVEGLGAESSDAFEQCKETIDREAERGWRLKQIVMPLEGKGGKHYRIILEKKV